MTVMTTLPLLSFLIWIPIIGGILLLFFRNDKYSKFARPFGLFITLSTLLLCVLLLRGFDTSLFDMQWQENVRWIPNLNIYYTLGVDGFSTPLIVLTCFMTLLVVLASYYSLKTHVTDYMAAFLIMQGLIIGALAAVDAILFYIFWEAMLVPMFLIIGLWGGKNRIYATLKFFLFTFLGSVLLLVALIYLQMVAKGTSGIEADSVFNILTFQDLALDFGTQKWIFLAFLIAFAVKVPMFPIHTWLPDAHVEAPTGGSVILAAILLKMGGYGFVRFLLPITPDASQFFAKGIIGLSLVAIVYIALVALMQKDMKKLIAYSSVSHMGFVTLGFFLAFFIAGKTSEQGTSVLGIEGGMVQMISHGFISAALFLCVGVLYDRMHTRLIRDYGGVVNSMPVFASFFMLFAMANVGLPGTSGFVGEFLVILGAAKARFLYAAIAASILILGASYTLWMYKRVIFGEAKYQDVIKLQDITGTEKIVFSLLAFAIVALGVWPQPLLDLMHVSAGHLVEQMLQSKL